MLILSDLRKDKSIGRHKIALLSLASNIANDDLELPLGSETWQFHLDVHEDCIYKKFVEMGKEAPDQIPPQPLRSKE